jgi:hypothetical protein
VVVWGYSVSKEEMQMSQSKRLVRGLTVALAVALMAVPVAQARLAVAAGGSLLVTRRKLAGV